MIKNLSALIECSFGRCPTVKAVKEYIGYISEMGYTRLYLGLTDGYKIPAYPYFNYKRGGFTTEELREIDRFGIEHGVEVIGSIQTIGHLHFLKRHEAFRDMFDTDDVLLADDERVLELNEKMLEAISEGLSSRTIQIGFDEAEGAGSGKYRELHNGYVDRKVILLRHLNRVVEMAKKFGYTCEIWHDMMICKETSVLTAEDVKRLIPEGVRVFFWNYRETDTDKLRAMLKSLKEHCTSFGYAGAVRKDNSFAPKNALALASLFAQMSVASEEGVEDFIVTAWTNGGGQASLFAPLPALFTAAEYAKNGCSLNGGINKAKFREICGADYDDMWSLGYLDDPFKTELPCDGTRSRWILENDILFGNFDMLLSEGTDSRYLELAEFYQSVEAGRFNIVFKNHAALARVLSVKSRITASLRTAYAARDKQALERLAETDLKELIKYTREFIEVFNEFWLDDSMAFGLEFNQRMLGGMLARFEYAYRRVKDFAERDIAIEELEGITLPPSLSPSVNENNWRELKPGIYMSSVPF